MRRLGRDAVFDEALRSSLSEWYIDAIDTAGIAPIGEPDINFAEDVPGQGEPLAFSIEIGVRPTAKLGQYKGLEVGRREPAVDDAAVDAEVERLRDRLATLDTVERPAETGDYVVLDYLGRVDGEPFPGGEGRDQLIELGSGRLVEGFEDQLIGASAGDERSVSVTFPADYAPELAGKDATFDVKVGEVKAKRLPELDDDFASEASEFDTLAELREDIAGKLRHADEHAVEREFEQAVLEAAANEAEVELPDTLVHARAHEMLEQTFSALARQGIGKDTYLKIAGKDEEELAHEAEPEAAAALRREAVLAAVVAAEQIAALRRGSAGGAHPRRRARQLGSRRADGAPAQGRAPGGAAPGRRHQPGGGAAGARGHPHHGGAGSGARKALDSRERGLREPAQASSGPPAADALDGVRRGQDGRAGSVSPVRSGWSEGGPAVATVGRIPAQDAKAL